ncbi:MAG: HD domain-containing protein [Blautia sp.]|nr:HD domain-containing protein [Blautia sp.]
MLLQVFCILAVAIIMCDASLAYISIHRRTRMGTRLGVTLALAGLAMLCYLLSLIFGNIYTRYSILTTSYFISIDFLLLSLLVTVSFFIRLPSRNWHKIAFLVLKIFMLFDIAMLIVNIRWSHCFSYSAVDPEIGLYEYKLQPWGYVHVGYSYVVLALIFAMVAYKFLSVPREYKITYGVVVAVLIATVAFNNISLLLADRESWLYNILDFSVMGYSLGAYAIFWSTFRYRKHGLLNRLKMEVFDKINQGIVLFDDADELIILNKKTEELLPKIRFREGLSLNDFAAQCNIESLTGIIREQYSIQCYGGEEEGKEIPLRCDFRVIRNKQHQMIGKLLVFSNITQETDFLTGFHSWENFKEFITHNTDALPDRMRVIVCDPNRLSVTNSTISYDAGNKVIKDLSRLMKKHMPKDTYFVRGHDAHLVALSFSCIEEDVIDYLEMIREEFKDLYSNGFQYAVGEYDRRKTDLLSAVQMTCIAMRNRKLLDQESIHSSSLTSLIRALQECDSDTEEHVKRTMKMGAKLGRRLGLSDIEQSDLALLCILHDIGKIGVPLEILNKPGKLSQDEKKTIQTHVEKGYQIAQSTKELQGIAEMILYHHERWDGKGYPSGLSNDNIPILSRVIAVVDAYDAMVNDRAYRARLTEAVAQNELMENAGTQFDPVIVSQFLQMLRDEGKIVDSHEKQVVNNIVVKGFNIDFSEREDKAENHVHEVVHTQYFLDEQNKILTVDDWFEKLTGYTEEDVQERKLSQMDLIPEEDRTEYMIKTGELLASDSMAYLEHRIRRKDGTDIFVFCMGRVYFDPAVRANRSQIIVTNLRDTYSLKHYAIKEQKGNTP